MDETTRQDLADVLVNAFADWVSLLPDGEARIADLYLVNDALEDDFTGDRWQAAEAALRLSETAACGPFADPMVSGFEMVAEVLMPGIGW